MLWANKHFVKVDIDFKNYDMELIQELKNPVPLSSVGLNTMVEPKTGIYPPSVIEIWGGEHKTVMKLLSTLRPQIPAKDSDHIIKVFESAFKTQPVSYLKIVARPLKQPDPKNPKGKKCYCWLMRYF